MEESFLYALHGCIFILTRLVYELHVNHLRLGLLLHLSGVHYKIHGI